MDPLTHTCSGIVLAHLIAPDHSHVAYTTVLVVAAQLPDIDFIVRPFKTLGSPKYYHNFTHSLLGICSMSPIAALLTYIFYPFAGPVQLGALYLLGSGVHILLDSAIASCYVRPLWPFSGRQVSMALLVGLNFRTASKKCGRPHYTRCLLCQLRGGLFNPALLILALGAGSGFLWPDQRRLVSVWAFAALGIGGAVLYLWKRRITRSILSAYPGVARSSLHVYPADVVPCRWLVIEETPTAYRLFSVRGLRPGIRQTQTLPKPETARHPAIEHSMQSPLLGLYKGRMAHPYAELREAGGLTTVTWKDLRYLQSPVVDLYALKLTYTPRLKLVAQEFRECWK